MPTANSTDVSANNSYRKKLSQTLAFRIGLGLALFVLIIFVSTLYVAQTRGREVLLEQAEKLNESVVQTITLKLQERLSKAESLTRSLANLGASMEPDPERFRRIVPSFLENTGMDNLVAGGGIWPEPYGFDELLERRSFFWGKNSAGRLEYYDDYNEPQGRGYHNEEWYVPARYLRPGGVYWSKSYMDPYSLEPMVTCTVPIYRAGKFAGVATLDLKLTGLSRFMSEQARVTGGYAFALDRNNRLLSKPEAPGWGLIEKAMNSSSEQDFPTLDELLTLRPQLAEVVAELKQVDRRYWETQQEVEETHITRLANAVADGSYQVELGEAAVIAHQLLTSSTEMFSQSFELTQDFLANEATSISVVGMPEIGWKVVVAMPTRYTNEAVSYISERIFSMLFVVLLLAAVFFVLFFHQSFIQPVNQLSKQVRSLIKRKDYETKLDTEKRDELGELAEWFNVRTEQLSDALEKLTKQNQALEETRAFAEAANESKSIFLASMSHEIRTPMNAIIGMTEVLSRMDLEKEKADYVKTIKSSSQGLLSLVNDIMDFSKVEAGKLDLEVIPFDLRAMLDDCADLIAFQAAEKNLEFIYYVAPKVPQKVLGDPGRIRQVVLNLMGNAVKFTSDGYVELWVECDPKDTQQNLVLSVKVRDSGIGIPDDKKAQLFTPFRQADSSTTREYGGTGLGLAISKRLAELMGGDITFVSERLKGTEFLFRVYLDIAEGEHADVLHHEQLGEACQFLALVNDREQGAALKAYAESMGYEFFALRSVETWLNKLQSLNGAPCISLVWELSSLGDLSVLKASTPKSGAPHSLLIVSSLHSDETLDLSLLNSEFDVELISAPIKYQQLVKAISQLAERANRHEPGGENPVAVARPWEVAVEGSSDGRTVNGRGEEGELSVYRDKKILVAEDNKVNQQVMMLLLEGLGLKADLAKDGLETVKALQAKAYDVILMDWQMPRMDGLEATREIRKTCSPEATRIIAVTANAMSGDIDRCLEAGMDDYVSKPVRIDELTTKLAKWLASV